MKFFKTFVAKCDKIDAELDANGEVTVNKIHELTGWKVSIIKLFMGLAWRSGDIEMQYKTLTGDYVQYMFEVPKLDRKFYTAVYSRKIRKKSKWWFW